MHEVPKPCLLSCDLVSVSGNLTWKIGQKQGDTASPGRQASRLEDDDESLPGDWGQWFPWTCNLIHGSGCQLWEISLRPIDGRLEG